MNMESIKELRTEFDGRGEVRGFHFKQILGNNIGYLYEVKPPFGYYHYEVFHRKVNQQYNCISYPKSASFSLWAWTYTNYEDALLKFNELED